MNNSKLKKIIDRYLSGKGTDEEKNFLENYLDSFQNFYAKWKDFELGAKSEVSNRIWNNLSNQIERQSFKSKFAIYSLSKTVLKYAAIILFFAGLIFIWNKYKEPELKFANQRKISKDELKSNLALLTSNGNQFLLNPDSAQIITDSEFGKIAEFTPGGTLIFHKTENNSKLTYTLLVPPAKQLKLVLQDETAVHLNSDSKFSFDMNSDFRKASLIGEAFFKVSKNTQVPFSVNLKNIVTKVYGTEFNISAYSDDPTTQIYLLEGSIGVRCQKRKEEKLDKYTLATINNKNTEFTKSYQKPDEFLSWRSGLLIFNNDQLESIIRKLQRKYNYKIIVKNRSLLKERFTGRFDVESIDEILNIFNHFVKIKYSKDEKNRTITIK